MVATGYGSATGYDAACDESWFYGSEVTARVFGTSISGLTAVQARGTGEIHLHGSSLRSINLGTGVSSGNAHSAAYAANGGRIHIHGTGIDVISETDSAIVGLNAESGGLIHANESAYVMQTGANGTRTRILNNGGEIRAPYLWEQAATPPDIEAVNADGADMAVQTGCAASGCQSSGTETHLLIYNSSCGGAGGPWFDVVTGSCR